ncbi:MAG: hypothetical protein ACO1OG_12045 [Devosia sp.]
MPDGLVLDIAIEARHAADAGRLMDAVERLATLDGNFRFRSDAETNQTILSGRDELQLDVLVTQLRETVALNVGIPVVAYRETISRPVTHDYVHRVAAGEAIQFARIVFRIEPLHGRRGAAFGGIGSGDQLPAEYVEAVARGVAAGMASGPATGFEVVDTACTLLDGAWHDEHSSALAFETAARRGLHEAIEKAGAQILEPIMRVVVLGPVDRQGDIIGDLNSRRGVVTAVEASGQRIEALVPVANMMGYAISLRALSQGRARFEMQFDHYAPTPLHPDGGGTFPPAMAMRA